MFFPSNSNSGFLLSAKVTQNCALGTPTPQYMHVQLAKWMQEPEFRMQLGYFALQTGAVSWSRHSLNDFSICTLDSHHGSAGNCLSDWEFSRTHDSNFYRHYCKTTNRKSSNTHTQWYNRKVQSLQSLKCHLNEIAVINTASSCLLKEKGPM